MQISEIQRVRELPEETYQMVLKVCDQLKVLNDLCKKVTGYGGWAIYTMLGSIVMGAILYKLFSLKLPDYLNYTDQYQNAPLGALMFIFVLLPATYIIGRFIAYLNYGEKLNRERDKLNELIETNTNFRRSLDALILIDDFNLASLEALPKNLKGAVKIHKKWQIQRGLKI